ncbi:Cytochrome b561, DM13 and DOMON domain-containing protein, partial [Cucurbita argyrosperma subsp. sororia]
MHHTPIFVGCFILICSIVCYYADAGSGCSKTSPLVDFESEFEMVQHQLRGSFRIIDDCSFRVSNFDMLSGTDVHWWGAIAPDVNNFTAGFVVSDKKLNETYKNASFIVHLKKNVKWDQIQVIAAWDLPAASDFGHVILRKPNNGSAGSPSVAPSPSEDGNPWEDTGSISIAPTSFENCKVLADNYRVRWTLSTQDKLIEIGLEGAIPTTNYMAFGWANPNGSSNLMIGADVAVMGINEDGVPLVDDFYITRLSECMINKDGMVHGVCPDTIFEGSDPVGLVNNTRLIYGHRRDGVSFVRYRRPLVTVDKKYDVPINHTASMDVIWAVGPMKPPDAIRPFYLPQNHGGTYGHLVLNVSEHVNDCLGPLDAEDKEDQDVVIADANSPLVVTSGPALHYPNPPNPAKVLYINKKEAPLLRVERGVPVKFSLQAGHDVALYITSDMLGGNATLRNMSETIYAGGPEAEGVQASPTELTWAPDRNTPDQVFYHSIFPTKNGLESAARGEKKSGYLAIGFGSGMINSYAYVGWMDEAGKGRVKTYWIDGKGALNVHPTKENLTFVRCKSESGIITLEFTRPLKPSCPDGHGPQCKNIIDPTTPLKVIWAMGAKWVDKHLSDGNMHSSRSSRPMRVLLMRGSAEAEQDLQPVLAVHGFMMFLAWGILLPGGILAARYLKHVKGDGWYQIHVYLQYSVCQLSYLASFLLLPSFVVFMSAQFMLSLGLLLYSWHERQRRRDRTNGRSNWVLGNEDDSVDLLGPTISIEGKESHPSGTMEVQLEPLRG